MQESKFLLPILFSKFNKTFTKQCEDLLKPNGLSKLHAFYLIYLHNKLNGAKLTELNDFLGCDKANTSRAIMDLEQKNIIERCLNSTNEKKYKVKLTDYGMSVSEEFVCNIKSKVNKLFKCLTDNELNALINIITKLVNEGEKI